VIVKAKNKETGKYVAIKQMVRIGQDILILKSIIREVYFLRKLSKLNLNLHTSVLQDVIAPDDFNYVENPYLFLVLDFVEMDLFQFLD
jgi:hypothetical protein